MSDSIPNKISLTPGASRLDAMSSKLADAFVTPDAANLIKNEHKTVIWRMNFPPHQNLVVKMYRRRSLVHWYRERAVRFRVQREYEALRVLEVANVPCSVPLFWGYGLAAEHGRFEILVTREIQHAAELRTALARNPKSIAADNLCSLFDIVRQMHRCGIYHGALSPKNILITPSVENEFAFHVIDMARSITFSSDISNTTMARADLLSVLRRLVQLRGDAGCEEMLLRYGCPQGELKAFMTRLKQHPSARKLRNRLTVSFTIRSWFHRYFGSRAQYNSPPEVQKEACLSLPRTRPPS